MRAIRDLVHLANHATYHRGFMSTLLYPERVNGRANDYSAIDTTLALLFSPLAGFHRPSEQVLRVDLRVLSYPSFQAAVAHGYLKTGLDFDTTIA